MENLELITKAGSFYRRSQGFLLLWNAGVVPFYLDRNHSRFYPDSNSSLLEQETDEEDCTA
jgi:hypothetical protein